MSYSASPDGPPAVFDPERGSSTSPTVKVGGYRPADEYEDRALERASARELDEIVELSGLTRARRDLERAYPRSAAGPVPPQRRRELPIPDAIRTPPSARQRNARSRAKRIAQSNLPTVGYKAVDGLISDPNEWESTGEALTEVGGDAHQLDDATRSRVQRIDRAIRTAEKSSDRDHVVYCAVRLPHQVPDSAGSLPDSLAPGSRIEFDRFTMTAHSAHQVDQGLGAYDVLFEIATGRGMYLGRSDKVDDTAHLLPRGMSFDVVSAGEGRYRRSDDSIGRRMIVQLRDVTEGQ